MSHQPPPAAAASGIAPPGAAAPATAAPATAPPGTVSSSSVDRRSFLRTSAGGAAVLGLAAVLPAGCARGYPQAQHDDVALRALSPKEYAVARAAAEALLVGVPVGAAAVASAIDAELAAVGEPVRADMKSVFALFEHLTLLDGQRRRFTALTPERRLRVLRGWSRSRFVLRRGAYQAVRGFVYYFAFIDDATRPLTGFLGPWPERVAIPATPIDFGPIA